MIPVQNTTDIATEQIIAMLEAAVAKARTFGAAINVALVDRGGATCGFLRMPNAHLGAVSVALDKAWTSVSFGGMSTRAMSEWMSTHPPHVMAVLLNTPRCTPLTGALPVRLEGMLVGAVGVSGAAPDQDEACCRAALEAIGADID